MSAIVTHRHHSLFFLKPLCRFPFHSYFSIRIFSSTVATAKAIPTYQSAAAPTRYHIRTDRSFYEVLVYFNMKDSTVMFSALGAAATIFCTASAHGSDQYTLKDDMSHPNFFDAFNLFSGPDPTQGFVQYQAMESAIQNQYVGYFDDIKSIYLGVDYKNQDSKGRASIRVEGKKLYNQGLLVADIRHMPPSTCGTWPAFWLLGTNNGQDAWPDFGEIDILEGVNEYEANAVTLHTSAGCAVDNATTSAGSAGMDQQTAYLGTMATSNCDVKAADQDKNVGCSIKAPKPGTKGALPSYGTNFNSAGGGVYATEWTSTSISTWFFPHNSTIYTSQFAKSNSTTLDTSTWGTPLAKFQGAKCDFTQRFKDMKIIFDTTFCGEWAGKVWNDTCAAKTGAATCQEYVQKNPAAFADAYWEIASLKWYEQGNTTVKRGVAGQSNNVRQPGRPYAWLTSYARQA